MTCGVPHVPTEETRKLVSELAAFGNTQVAISLVLEISHDTLVKYYRHEWETAKVKAVHKVGKSLYQKAVEDNDLGAQIFYLKTQGGWREPKEESKSDTLIEKLLDKLV